MIVYVALMRAYVAVGQRTVHVRRPRLQQVGEPEGQVADGDHQVAAHGRLHRPARGQTLSTQSNERLIAAVFVTTTYPHRKDAS